MDVSSSENRKKFVLKQQQGDGQTTSSTQGEMFQITQTVQMSASMLDTYAKLRGRSIARYDPLHQALYVVGEGGRGYFRAYIYGLPSIEELNKGAKIYWDPATLIIPQPTPDHRPRSKPVGPGGMSFREFIDLNPPSVGQNHYKADMSRANFGYVLVNGKWVDPDDACKLHRAFMSSKGGISTSDFADSKETSNTGPRIMSLKEQDIFYDAYVDYVTDDLDKEGDPRALRITPATFAIWASGAVSGDRYEEGIVMSSEQSSPRKSSTGCESNCTPRPEYQFDVDDGSCFSGYYEEPRTPSPLHSAPGVDVHKTPRNFSYSYPGVAQTMEREAYGDAKNDAKVSDWLTRTESEAKTSQSGLCVVASLGGSDTNPSEFDEAKQHLQDLRRKRNAAMLKTYTMGNYAREIAGERTFFHKEIYFMKEKLEHDKNATTQPTASYSTPPPATTTPPPTPPSPTASQAAKAKRRLYKRYLAEAIENEALFIEQSRAMNERITADIESILDDMAELRIEKDDLLEKFGVKDSALIPGLFPQSPEDTPSE